MICYAVLCGLALSILLGLLSDGVYHDDDLTHFLMARWAGWYPDYMLHVWGRSGLTVPLAAVSWIGKQSLAWHMARGLSAVITAVTAYLAARFALGQGMKRAWLVIAACYAQPLNMVLSFTTLAETFSAFYLILAAFLLQRRRLVWACALFSMTLLTRHEAVVFVPIWFLAVFLSKSRLHIRVFACLLSLWAPIVNNLLYRWRFDRWPFLIFTQPHGSTQYLPSGPLSYLPDALYSISPTLMALAIIGGVAMCRRRHSLAPAMAAVFLLTHLVIKARGLYASGGYGRFMVTVAPFMAIMAAAGVNTFIEYKQRIWDLRRRWLGIALVFMVGWIACELEISSGRWAGLYVHWRWVARVIVGMILFISLSLALFHPRRSMDFPARLLTIMLIATWMVQWLWIVHPLRLKADQMLIREAQAWLKKNNMDKQPFFSTDPWFPYFFHLVENPRAHKDAALLASMPVGTVFVWDSKYSGSDFHNLPLGDYLSNPHYRLLNRMQADGPSGLLLYLFRKISVTPIPKHLKQGYPPPMMNTRPPIRGIYYRREG